MRVKKAQVQNYRSVMDSGEFEIDRDKTILVGINEAGKSAILAALQHINPPKDVKPLHPLRDYPRSRYNEDIKSGAREPSEIPIATAVFELEDADREVLPEHIRSAVTGLKVTAFLDNHRNCDLLGEFDRLTHKDIKNDLRRIAAHADKTAEAADPPRTPSASAQLDKIEESIPSDGSLRAVDRDAIKKWLKVVVPDIAEQSEDEQRLERVEDKLKADDAIESAVEPLEKQVPRFVLFNNYFRVRARLHLESLARKQGGPEPIEREDYGNLCLLNLLGYEAKELADLGRISDAQRKDHDPKIQERIDERRAGLDSAEERLTREIRRIWNPDPGRDEAKTMRIQADGPYLNVTVQDSIGTNIDLDQRSEGFQWLVSFFVVFFSEAKGQLQNAVLLLDEPGVSLHALKQREFQKTISRLAESNQTIFTTHSPFLVGSGELDLVRVVEMTDRSKGTKVNTSVTSEDPASLLPLQEALGYDMAHSLFSQERNLVAEGLTDYFYLSAMAELLRAGEIADMNEKIAVIPAGTAGRVTYFATILHAHKLKVAALLDSDTAGDNEANREELIHALKQRAILRTKDHLKTPIAKAEIEDMLRETLVAVAKDDLGWDVEAKAKEQPNRPIISLFENEVPDFGKYKLAKAFLRWARTHEASDLTEDEREQWKGLVEAINRALK
ncbi:AAA family ATPase [Roseospirillum parvum]|uniref:AAA ATPase domain-containing protein n=1 Tax=Roseospirillum parvum TaxID=83401 RepID=A0A1G7ZZP2_9PROT|nr:AAA family ATPase [Roseospirillum parvum]SDH13630.1 AAA ATPase domain-containing protein [Roseospirillum parvum]